MLNKAAIFKNKSWAVILAFFFIWLLFTIPLLRQPWLIGFDPVTRLYNINQLLVTLQGNIWLPLYQLIIRFIFLITEDIFYLKLTSFVFASLGIVFLYLSLEKLFGLAISALTLIFFLIHPQASGTATSLYMESLFLLNFSLSLFFFLNKKILLSSSFFILATFSRPELLMAAPILIIGYGVYKNSYRKALILSLLYLPILTFYLYLKANSTSDFRLPMQFSLEKTAELAYMLLQPYFHQWPCMIQGFLALIGVYLVCFSNYKLKNRKLLLLTIPALILFFLLYIIVFPFLHGQAGGSRKSFYIMLPACIYSGIAIIWFYEKYKNSSALIGFLIGVMIANSYHNIDRRMPDAYRSALLIAKSLDKTFNKDQPQYYCIAENNLTTKRKMFDFDYIQILVYLKSLGWKLQELECQLDNPLWLKIIQKEERAVIRIYNPLNLDTKFIQVLQKNCSSSEMLRSNGRIFGRFCL